MAAPTETRARARVDKTIAERVAESRAAQGLAPRITDRAALAVIAAAILGGDRRAT